MSDLKYIKEVAIVGATGRVGGHFLEALLETGKHHVTVLTRPSTAVSFPANVKVAHVDYSNPSTLIEALRGQQFLVITLSVQAPPDTHSTIVKAALAAGVPFIMPNGYGGDFELETLRAEDPTSVVVRNNAKEIKELGASYIALSCGFWYEWSLALGNEWFGIDIKNRKATFFGDGTKKINTSTWRQCGRVLAALLSLPVERGAAGPALEQWKNDRLFVSSFRVSQRDMLDSLHRVLGTTDEDWEISYESFEKRIQDGMKQLEKGEIKGFAKSLYARNISIKGAMDFGDRLANETLGLPVEDLDEATKRAVEMVETGWDPLASIAV